MRCERRPGSGERGRRPRQPRGRNVPADEWTGDGSRAVVARARRIGKIRFNRQVGPDRRLPDNAIIASIGAGIRTFADISGADDCVVRGRGGFGANPMIGARGNGCDGRGRLREDRHDEQHRAKSAKETLHAAPVAICAAFVTHFFRRESKQSVSYISQTRNPPFPPNGGTRAKPGKNERRCCR